MQFEWCDYGRDALFNERPSYIKSFEIDFNEEMDKLNSKFKNSVLRLIEKKELMSEALSYQKERDSK